ncbi:uncharacterized protein LOC133200469 [Saccostrea echinata]|uniref:uncharacterized protein LOC133200469 n=1 Tax=Saccostrea echinata TaxID=191078 RepID=UPI002A801BB9|nr:uncharacterized protein LOC133200469 [Saccostrea echinata]
MNAEHVKEKKKNREMNWLIQRPILPLTAVIIIFLQNVQITNANTDSCSASKSTVQSVENCPTSKKEWIEASQRKNCSAFASQCSDPGNFVYHCVISSSLNGTLEVCAYKKIIVFGYCTEYSYSANRIQPRLGAACTNFIENPCPTGYPSNETYKYPGCYNLTKKSTTEKPTTMIPFPSDTTVLTTTVSVLKGSGGHSEDKGYIVSIIIGVVAVLVAIVLAILVYRRRRRKREGQQQLALDNKSFDEESNQRKATEEGTSEERRNLVPSGKPAHAGKENIIERVEDEEAVILIKPEKEEENDCETLVNLLSDGLERLGILQSECSSEDNSEHNKKLTMIASKIYEDSTSFSNETSSTIHEHIIELESLERYFQRPKVKENVYLPPE